MGALIAAGWGGLPALLGLGAVVGVLAGLLGIGGGAVLVPALSVLLPPLGVPPDQAMNVALGTSLTNIIFTATSSTLAHHRRGAVRWDVLAGIAPGVLVGTFSAAWITARLPIGALRLMFVGFLFYAAYRMIWGRSVQGQRPLPGRLGLVAVGGGVGFVSGLVGIGGGVMSVPFLAGRGVKIHQAIGSSAAIGLPIAVAGAAGNIVGGWGASGLPPGSLGFVYLPALACVVVASTLTAPLGVRLAHRLDVQRLRRIFAALLLLVGLRMLARVLGA